MYAGSLETDLSSGRYTLKCELGQLPGAKKPASCKREKPLGFKKAGGSYGETVGRH
jgi:hypothetical protein